LSHIILGERGRFGAVIKKRRNPTFLIIVTILAVLFGLVSSDGLHYWHEVRFLYATWEFPLSEILAGKFNPHQLGGEINEESAAGFYSTKLLHLTFLKVLFSLVPPSRGGFVLASWISIGVILIVSLLTLRIFSKIGRDCIDPWLAAACFIMAPVSPYLAGKVLSEVDALLFLALSILAFLLAFEGDKIKFGWSVGSGIFLLLAGLARVDIIIGFGSFWVSLYLFGQDNFRRKRLCIGGAVVTIIFLVGYLSIFIFLDLNPKVLVVYFLNFIGLSTKSIPMSVWGMMSFGGIVYLFAICSIFSAHRKAFVIFFAWFALASLPMILITANYMIEPRYLVNAIIPLAGLGALGLNKIVEMIRDVRWAEKMEQMAKR